MEAPKTTAAAILRDAKRIPVRETLATHKETITTLREKNYTWREIAEFFRERGIETDHSKLFRFMQRQGNLKMTTLNNFTVPNDFVVPTTADYVRVLSDLEIHPNYEKMLECHYLAHNRTVNYAKLAEHAGYEIAEAANLHYGKFGRKLGETLSMTFIFDGAEPFYSSSIGAGNTFLLPNAKFELIMHHELAKAIQQLDRFKSWNTP